MCWRTAVASPYAHVFRNPVERGRARLHGRVKIFLPILGDPYGAVLERGELKLTYEDGSFLPELLRQTFSGFPGDLGLILEPGIEPLSRPIQT